MMDFDDALAEVPTRRSARLLRVDEVLGKFDDQNKQAALRALQNSDIPIGRLVKAFEKMGHLVSYDAFRTWRSRNGVA